MTSAIRMGQRAVNTHVISAFSLRKRQPRTKKRWRDQRNIRQCQDHRYTSGIHDFQKEFVIYITLRDLEDMHSLSKDSAKPYIHDTTTTVLG
jgi:hypothetical protein